MECVEDEFFSTDYHNPESRSIGNALIVTLNDGTVLDEVEILYPVGHKRYDKAPFRFILCTTDIVVFCRRRAEGTPLLEAKFMRHMKPWYPAEHVDK